MRKLVLKKENLSSLTTDELASVAGAASGQIQCDIYVNTVKDTECGYNCVYSTPINQCLISIGCYPNTA